MSDRPKVLVKEKIADSGIDLLSEHFDVDVGVEWDDQELAGKIAEYDGIVIRSATQLTADLIDQAKNLKVIGRAGVGVDNVDVKAATKNGVVVANAPQSNVVAAAEQTLALMLALARNTAQAHSSLTSGKWERSKFGGVEVYEKTLGVFGFGRIGQLVAQRAKGFDMNVVAFDPYAASDRFRELGVEQAGSIDEVFERADFITLHLPNTEDTKNFLDAEAFAKMKDGVRVINCARGPLIDDEALKQALDSGKVAGAALDVYVKEPITDHPLFSGYDNVVVTPHLGASTEEAQDRAGVQTAEQIVAALTGGVVTTAVNIPAIGAEEMKTLKPLTPLCEKLGSLATGIAAGTSIDKIEIEFLGRLADIDTGLLKIAVLKGALDGHTDEQVNYVNAPSIAETRGIAVSETKDSDIEEFAELIRVTVDSGGKSVSVAGTTFGPKKVPYLVEVWDQRFKLELEPNVVLFRYIDQPGMIGRVGSVLGNGGVNVSSAAVGRQPESGNGSTHAAMVVTTSSPVADELVDEIVASEGFEEGRSVTITS